MEGEREWEVWNQRHINKLLSLWGNPQNCQGRHRELVYRVANLVEGESVLDVGCGMGHLYAQFKPGINYHGVDVSEFMIDTARSFFPDETERFQVGDVYNLSGIPKFNAVISVDLLIHLPEIEKPIQQLWSRTRHHCILTMHISSKAQINRVGGGGYGEIHDKYLVQRRETVEKIYQIFAKLDNLGKIERYFFDSSCEIFKLTRGIKRRKTGKHDEWKVDLRVLPRQFEEVGNH